MVSFLLCAAVLHALAVLTVGCPVATLAWQAPFSAINATTPGAMDNKYGFEDGIVVRRQDGTLTMIAAEMYGDPKWVSMRLGVWDCADPLAPLGGNWTKLRSIRRGSGNFDGSDAHSSSWGPFVVYDDDNSTWAVSYVGYRGAPSNSSGWLENFQGTIFSRYAGVAGDAGLDSDFFDATYNSTDAILLSPDDFRVSGPWPHPCQGLQGTDSFYPYRLNSTTWAALVGTSHQETPDPWPQPGGGKWPVSLATSPSLAGPWARYNPAAGGAPEDAPCVDINGGFSENPIVSRRPDNASAFHAVLDYIGQEGTGFGYVCSEDGLAWGQSAIVKTPTGCRTPFGLVPLTPDEVRRATPSILAYGTINATQLAFPTSALAWSFYTYTAASGFEEFQASITYLDWTGTREGVGGGQE